MNERHRILLETSTCRDKAEMLLRSLLDAKSRSESYMLRVHRGDPYRETVGRSSLDVAIASTESMLETLNRQLERFKNEVAEEAWSEVGERLAA